MKHKSYVLDTSVIVEIIDEESPYKEEVEKLFRDISSKRIEAYISSVTLSEVLYVASRIYMEAGSDSPNKDAKNFIMWIWRHPYINLVDATPEIGIVAGELRKVIKISLINCYVLATAKNLGSPPLFLKLEREMRRNLVKLKDFNIEFLVSS